MESRFDVSNDWLILVYTHGIWKAEKIIIENHQIHSQTVVVANDKIDLYLLLLSISM